MKIKVTKVFANYLNKLAKQGVLDIDHAEVKTFSERQYELNVGDPWDADEYGDCTEDWVQHGDDFNFEPVYKAIVVFYPDSYYAMPKCISTELLVTTAKWRKVTTEEELKEMLKDLINI